MSRAFFLVSLLLLAACAASIDAPDRMQLIRDSDWDWHRQQSRSF